MRLTIATCQFPSGGDVDKNLRYMLSQMKQAARHGAHVAHFHEAALSGYSSVCFKSFKNYDWQALHECTQILLAHAKKLKMWVVFGSAHRLSGKNKPHNSVYVASPDGKIVDRYDKRFCTGGPKCDSGDLKNYTPGDHFTVFSIKGIKCGVLICHDFRYQELYREYKKLGVQLMFHSYHNANRKLKDIKKNNIWGIIVPPGMQTYAANNYMWISANNSSHPCSCWPSFFVLPDGVISGRLANDRPGVLITTIDTNKKYYDASEHWRPRAMRGVYNSGTLAKDKRSARRMVLA